MLCSDFPWNKHVYKPSSYWGTPMENPQSWHAGGGLCVLSTGSLLGRWWGRIGVHRHGRGGLLPAPWGLWDCWDWDVDETILIYLYYRYHGMNLKYWQCRICSRMNTMEFWETRMIVSLFSVISRSHIVESRVMESYPVLPLQYLYVVVSCRIFGVTMIYHSYFYRCF